LGISSPLDFSIQVQFETEPVSKKDGTRSPPGRPPSHELDAPFDEKPWQFPSIAARVQQAVSTVADDAARRDEFGPVEDLTRIQRLFRAAVEGRLGKDFPAHKLVALQRASAGSIKETRTQRWKPFPGQLEFQYLNHLRSFAAHQAAQHANVGARAISCLALSGLSAEDMATAGNELRIAPLAVIPENRWREACVVTEDDIGKDGPLAAFASYAERVAKTRQLRALVVDAADQNDRKLGPKGGGTCAPM
jgi:hypothetical protein